MVSKTHFFLPTITSLFCLYFLQYPRHLLLKKRYAFALCIVIIIIINIDNPINKHKKYQRRERQLEIPHTYRKLDDLETQNNLIHVQPSYLIIDWMENNFNHSFGIFPMIKITNP